MAIEAVVTSLQIPPQVVGNSAGHKQPVAKAEVVQKHQPNPVPKTPKIVINREPIISTTELEAKIVELNEAMVSRNQAVLFSTDAATGKDVVRVSNKNTGELIRQMPSVEALKAMQNIDQMMGLIFNNKT
jgi:flagellar protein FlaG